MQPGGTDHRKVDELGRIGLIAAMSMESGAFLRHIRKWERARLGRVNAVHFQSAGRECTLVTSGMGVRRATEATLALIEAFHPACMISFGIAGAVRQDIEIGDVIMATGSCSLENGSLTPIQPLTPLSNSAMQTTEQALSPHGARLLPGTTITTRGSQLILQKPQDLLNPILEMETAGILQAASANGIPLTVLRAVSDNPLEPIPFDLGAVMDDECNFRVGRLFQAILKHPRLLLLTWKMTRNSRIAADNAAIAVTASLSALFQTIAFSNLNINK